MILFCSVQFFAKVVNMAVISKINGVINFNNVAFGENVALKNNKVVQSYSDNKNLTNISANFYRANAIPFGNTSSMDSKKMFDFVKKDIPEKHLILKQFTGEGNKIVPKKIINKLSDAYTNLLKQAENQDFWTNLPKKIIETGMIDKVYDTVEKFKAPFGDDAKLIFVALGNPANADEAAKALGLGSNITYCCAASPHEIKNAINNAGGNLDKIQVMISSKSGSTFESNETYKFLLKEFENHYKKQGLSDEETKQKVAKHFLCLTDKNPSAKLKKEAVERGYATVDCVDNLASGFGDLAYDMPLLAYAGLRRDEMKNMINAADKFNDFLMGTYINEEKIVKLARDIFERPVRFPWDNDDWNVIEKNAWKGNNIVYNHAAQLALFDKYAEQKGAQKEQFIFHDTTLDLSSTVAQLYRESLRKVNLELNTYPRCAHSGLQSAIDRTLPNQPINNITNISTIGKNKPDSAYQLEAAHMLNAYNEGHLQKLIQLRLDNKRNGVTPESLAMYLMLKSHVAYYKNILENKTPQDIYKMPYVNGYKKIREELAASKN